MTEALESAACAAREEAALRQNGAAGGLTEAFGTSDADGARVWKQPYDAAETAVTLLLRRYGGARLARPEDLTAMLALIRKVGRAPTAADVPRRGPAAIPAVRLGDRAPRDNSRFVVTNLQQTPRFIYEKVYRARGDVENRIKELLDGLQIDRTVRR